MALGNFTFYKGGIQNLFSKISMTDDTIVAVLAGTNYTPSVSSHTVYEDVSDNVIGDTDYSPQELENVVSVILESGNILIDCDDISFGSNVTLSAKYLILLRRALSSLAYSDLLIGFINLNTASATAVVQSVNAEFTIRVPNGLFTVQEKDN